MATHRDVYSELAEDDEDTRLLAAHHLLTSLAAPGTDANIEYAVKRLTLGLASGRKSSRVGFSIALTELIAQLLGPPHEDSIKSKTITFERLMDLLRTAMTPEGNVSGQEIRDHNLGTLFGLEAILKSAILYPRAVEGGGHEYDSARAREVLDAIFDLAQKKPWLSEQCGFIVCASLNQAHDCAPDTTVYAHAVIDKLRVHGLTETPDGVAIWLDTMMLFPALALPPNPWHYRDPTHIKNRVRLANAMKNGHVQELVDEEGLPKIKTGYRAPRLHFAWDALLAWYFIPQCTIDADTNISNFRQFWRDLVDNNLFAAAVSDERKAWGFHVMCHAVRDAPTPFLNSIFSQNVMRCTINQLGDSQRCLHASAQQGMRTILTRGEADGAAALEMLRGLVAGNGTPSFDQLTRTKMVERLLQFAGSAHIGALMASYEQLIARPGAEDVRGAAVRRQLLVDQLMSLLRRQVRQAALEVAMPLLEMLSTFGYFKDNDPASAPLPPFSEATMSMFRSRLLSVFTILLGHNGVEKPEAIPYFVLRAMRHREKHQKERYSFVLELDDEIQRAHSAAWRAIKRIHKKGLEVGEGERARLEALNLLYSLVLFQLYEGDADSLGVLEELNLFYKELHRKKVGSESADVDSSVVLVELLLSLVAKRSKLLRSATGLVFGSYSSAIGEGGLAVLIKVLAAEENLRGQQSLFDEESLEQTADAPEHDSDTAPESPSDTAGSVVEEEAASANEAEEQEGWNSMEEALAKALDVPADETAMRDNESSSSDAGDMDDEQMLALDKYLAKVFQEKGKAAGRKLVGQEAKEAVVELKNRVLDFLDIFVKMQRDNELCFTLLVPLLQLARQTSSKQVGERAVNMVRDIGKLTKIPALAEDDSKRQQLYAILRAIHEEAVLGTTNAHGNASSQASLGIVKLIGARKAVEMYAETWTSWHSREPQARVHAAFFSDFISYRMSSAARRVVDMA